MPDCKRLFFNRLLDLAAGIVIGTLATLLVQEKVRKGLATISARQEDNLRSLLLASQHRETQRDDPDHARVYPAIEDHPSSDRSR